MDVGHWTYECKNQRRYVSKPSYLTETLEVAPEVNIVEPKKGLADAILKEQNLKRKRLEERESDTSDSDESSDDSEESSKD